MKRRIAEVTKRHENTRQELERVVTDAQTLLETAEIRYESQSVTA